MDIEDGLICEKKFTRYETVIIMGMRFLQNVTVRSYSKALLLAKFLAIGHSRTIRQFDKKVSVLSIG